MGTQNARLFANCFSRWIDPEWFLGKSKQESFGPASVITPTNQAAVARSAMAMSARGEEPNYASLVAANLDATPFPSRVLNPLAGFRPLLPGGARVLSPLAGFRPLPPAPNFLFPLILQKSQKNECQPPPGPV